LLASFEIKSGETSLAEKTYLPKQWLMTKQDSSITFGLNKQTSIPDTLIITYMDGTSEEIKLSGESVISL
jgi:hypothetical protein